MEIMAKIRNNWSFEEINKIYDLPLLELIGSAISVHALYHYRQEGNVR